MAKFNKDLCFGIMTLIGATLIHHTYGFLYVTGYFNISSGVTTFFTSAIFSCEALSTPLGALLSLKIGYIWSTILSILLSSGGIFLSRLTLMYGFIPLIMTCSVMFGIGIGAAYSVLYAVAAAWFPNHRSTVVGIIASGLGLGSLVMVPIQTAVINPNNIQDFTSQEIKENLPKAFLAVGGFVFALQITGFALLRRKPDLVLEVHVGSGGQQAVRNYTVLEALKSIDFYLAFFLNFFNSASALLTSSTTKLYGRDCGFDNTFLATILTFCSVFNCLGRIIWGYIGDRFSFKGPFIFLQIEWAFLWFTYPFITRIGGTGAKALFAIWSFLLFTCDSATFVLIPNAATRMFGPKYMPTIFGLIFAGMAPSNLILSAAFSQYNINGHWVQIYFAGAGFALIGLVLTIFLRDPGVSGVASCNPCTRMCDICRPVEGEEELLESEVFQDGEVMTDQR